MLSELLVVWKAATPRARTLALAIIVFGFGFVALWLAASRLDAVSPGGDAALRGQAVLTQPASVRVRIEGVGTDRGGATGQPLAWANIEAEAGGSATRYLAAGDSQGPNLCKAAVVPDQLPDRGYYVWQMDVQVRKVANGRAILGLHWVRFRGGAAEAGDSRELTLEPGAYHVFDFVPAPPESTSPCASLMLRVHVQPLVSAISDVPLAFDVWLLHQGPAERRWVHQQVTGVAGRRVAFGLDPLNWSPSGRALGGPSSETPVALHVTGRLLATLRPDGLVDVSVDAVRTLSLGDGRVRSGGEQAFTTKEGETAAILLPGATGQTSTRAPMELPHQLLRGVALADGKAAVDFARFFAGSKTSLYVRVQRRR